MNDTELVGVLQDCPKCTTCTRLKIKPVTNRFIGDNDYICYELNARTITMNALTGSHPDEVVCVSILDPKLFGCCYHSEYQVSDNATE